MVSFQTFSRASLSKARTGGAMVEAAIFFPIAVLAAMAVILLMLSLYSQSCLQSNLHISLRAAAANETGKTSVKLSDAYLRDRYRRESERIAIYPAKKDGDGGIGFSLLEASAAQRFYGNRLTNPLGYESRFWSEIYVLDEGKIVLWKNAAAALVSS